MNKNWKFHYLFRLVLLIVMGTFILTGCQQNQPAEGDQVSPQASATAAPEDNAPAEDETATQSKTLVYADGHIEAEAEVKPAHSVELTFSMNGIVSDVLVEEGEDVKAGDIIAVLREHARLQATVVSAELELLNAQQAYDDLHKYAGLRRAEAEVAVAEADLAYDDAKERWEDSQKTKGDQDQIDVAYSNFVRAQNYFEEIEADYLQVAKLTLEDDRFRAYKQTEYIAAKKARDRALAQLNYFSSVDSKLDSARVEANLETAKADLEKTQHDLELLQEGPNPDDLALAKAQLESAQYRLEATNRDLRNAEIRAPFDGRIVNNNLKIGEYVYMGNPLVTLGDLTSWQVETTDLTELEVINIKPGDTVQVGFDALPDVKLPGVIKQIKPVGKNRQGDITYTVVIDIQQGDEKLRWNMTALVSFHSPD